LASNLFLSAYCPAADSERYFVEDYFAVSAVSGAEIQANGLQCKTLPRQITKDIKQYLFLQLLKLINSRDLLTPMICKLSYRNDVYVLK